jgi:hypothetical protein
MILQPPTSLDDLSTSFIGGVALDPNMSQNYSSQVRGKQLKTSHLNNRVGKPLPMSSVHMAKDIYRKGNTVS